MSRKITDLEKQWFLSSTDGHIDDMKNLFEKDPNLVTKKDFIMTALHWAAKNGSYEMVDFLLELGVDIASKTGYTPLHLATMYNHNNVVLLLVDNYGASVDVRDHSGKKPKDYLHRNAMPSVKDKLQKRDFNNQKNEDKPMTNISNMFLEMCLITPPQLDVCKDEGNAVLLSPFCLPPKPEAKTAKLKNSVRHSQRHTFRKASPKLRKPTRVLDDENYNAKMKIGPPLLLKENYFLDFSRIPRNERARSEPDFGRLIQEFNSKIEEN